METIKTIGEIKAHEWGLPHDYALKQRIERLVIPARATIIQRRYDQTKVFPSALAQTIKVKLERIGAGLYKTTQEIPQPLIIRGDSFYSYVGTTDYEFPFDYIPQHRVSLVGHRRYSPKRPYYYDDNKYMVVGNVKGLCDLNIRGVFDDPIKALEMGGDNNYCFLDGELQIESSLLQGVLALIEEKRPKMLSPDLDSEVNVTN